MLSAALLLARPADPAGVGQALAHAAEHEADLRIVVQRVRGHLHAGVDRALAESMPGLDVGRLRNLYVQLGEIALRAGDGEAAA